MKTGIMILALLAGSLLQAKSIYKCTTETGTDSYQETPCQGNAPSMLETKGIVDEESYQESLKLSTGSLAKYEVSMLTFKWWKFFKNEVSDQFLHFKFTDNTGDTDISLLIDFIEPNDDSKLDQMKVKNLVADKGKVFEKMSVLGKTNIKTLEVEGGYGYYATYKDASLVGKTSYPAGEFLNTTQGMLKKSGLLINFTLLSNDTAAENHIFALQFLANGILIEEQNNDTESETSLLDRAYTTYYEGAKLKALILFEQLVKEEPDQFKSWIGYCLALRDNNRLQMALVACDKALGFKPGDPDVMNSVINIMIKARHYEKGLQLARQLIQSSVKPQILDTINNLGFYAMIDGNFTVARDALELVKREAGPTRKVMIDLAELDYLQGNKEQAVATFEKIVSQQTNDKIKKYYLDPIREDKTIHPPLSYHESYTDIPTELLNIGHNQLTEDMVQPWVKRFYPVLGVAQLEINMPEKWGENVQLKTVDDQTKQLALIIADMDPLTQIRINLGKVDQEWTLSDLETHMRLSLKLYFEDKKLILEPISSNGKGFQYKGTTVSKPEPAYVYAKNLLDGVISLNVVGVMASENQNYKNQLAKVINSIQLTSVNQTALKKSSTSPQNSNAYSNKSTDEIDLPTPPNGYSWLRMPKAMAAALKPDGWFEKTENTADAVTYIISKESLDAQESFETGFTLIAVKDIKSKSGLPAIMFPFTLTKEIEDDSESTVIQMEDISQGPFTSIMVQYENHPENMPPIIIHKAFIANEDTNSLYIIIFEAPKDEWTEAWNTGEVMFKKYFLDDAF
jgi:tetratricopeptide (TPR) repeat protein